ncbi:MAG: hypothetical protein DME93_06125, partial [Verrucomicrobia bacterium]
SFDTSDHSRNNFWVGVAGFGEGYHNNHHAQPRCAAHGLRWWEFDLTRYVIWVLEKFGLAWQVVWPAKVSLANGLRPVHTSHPASVAAATFGATRSS